MSIPAATHQPVYNADPQTVEDFISNAHFQLDNVDGYTQMARDRVHDFHAARIKAECLVEAANELLAKLEAECRAEDEKGEKK